MKKMLLFFILILISAAVVISSCKKSSDDLLAIPCDTTSVSYAADIAPILQQNCYSCHGNGNTGGSGGILLEGYANLGTYIANGQLAGDVSAPSGASGGPGATGMPYGGPQLPSCELNKILAWIHQGVQNN
jgi:mono/diheme cytochrome c family protein